MYRCSTRVEEAPSGGEAFTAADATGNAERTVKRSVAFERSNKNREEPMSEVDQSATPAGDGEEFEDEDDTEGMLLYQRKEGPHKMTRSRFVSSKYKKNR